MVYKVGKINYTSVKSYQRFLMFVWGIFLVCLIPLFALKDNMAPLLFYLTLVIDVFMLVHLLLRVAHSKKWISYPFDEY